MPSLAELMKGLTPRQNQYVARLVASLPEEYGGLNLPLSNTAMDRMKLMRQPGLNDLYHGGAEEIMQLDPSKYGSSTGAKSAKQAFWTVDEPSTAVGYSHYAATHAPIKRLMQQAEKYEKLGDWDTYDDILAKAEDLERQFQESNLAGQNVMPLVALKGQNQAINLGGQHFIDEEQKINRHLLQSKAKRSDFATFENLSDDPFFDSRPAQHVAVLNPSKIRSKFAGFNPWRKEEANLLASHPIANAIGLAGLGKLLSQGQDVDLRGSINDYLSEGYDPASLEQLTGVAPTTRKGDIALEALGAFPGPIGTMAASASLVDMAENADWKKIKKSISNYFK